MEQGWVVSQEYGIIQEAPVPLVRAVVSSMSSHMTYRQRGTSQQYAEAWCEGQQAPLAHVLVSSVSHTKGGSWESSMPSKQHATHAPQTQQCSMPQGSMLGRWWDEQAT